MSENGIVMALGFFDGIHLGHCALMRRVTELAESLLAQAAAITRPYSDSASGCIIGC